MRRCWVSRLHTGAPAAPRLVNTWMTPAEASVPYRVVAAEPLMTSMRSMSLGSMKFSGCAWTLPAAPEVPAARALPIGNDLLCMRTPST